MTSEPVPASPQDPDPAPSAVRLVFLVLEGYLYIAFVVGVFVAAVAVLTMGIASRRPLIALAAIFVGLPVLYATASAIRSLFFRMPQPVGVPLTAEDAPALHAEVDTIRRAVGAPRVHRIIVIEHFNASAQQLARFGLFWPRNYLLLGFPLFGALSPEHLRAVIAHELGHLSRTHGRLSVWVYRLQLSWARLMRVLASRGFTPAHATLLLRWYAPRLQTYSTAVARRQELLADMLAAGVVGANVAAETVVALGVLGPMYEEMLQQALAALDDDVEELRPFTRRSPDLWPAVATRGKERLESLLVQPTERGDTHPSLADRLAAIGAPARIPGPPARTAGDAWFGRGMADVAARLDERWAAGLDPAWRRQYTERRECRRRLAELKRLAAPTPAQMFEWAGLLESLGDVDAARPLYERAMESGHPGATLATGRLLLDAGDECGVALIEGAIRDSASLSSEGYRRIAEFYSDRGHLADANRYATRARAEATRAALTLKSERGSS